MLRATSQALLGRLTGNELKHGNSIFALEFVRWRRKPRWVPVAKSKIFRVPERKKQPEEERVELLRLNNNYKLQLRSVRQYLREETHRIEETSTADHYVLTSEQEEAEFQRCLKLNDEWNAKIAAERAKRLAKEREERAALIKQRLENARIREEERLEKIEAIVRREKELSKTFITPDNIDAAIEYALANPVDYNFALDLKGNIYRGRKTVPGGSGTPAPTSTTDSNNDDEQTATSSAEPLAARN